MKDENREIIVSAQQLCQFLTAAEDVTQNRKTFVEHSLRPGFRRRKRSETPPKKIASDNKKEYVQQEQKAFKRMEQDDPDYEATTISVSSD